MPEIVPMGAPDSRCRECGYIGEPAVGSKVSAGGWVTLVVLVFLCLPLFWVGLLLREQYPICPRCRWRMD
jgi:hypothetical protein